jgi:hypothetical protein
VHDAVGYVQKGIARAIQDHLHLEVAPADGGLLGGVALQVVHAEQRERDGRREHGDAGGDDTEAADQAARRDDAPRQARLRSGHMADDLVPERNQPAQHPLPQQLADEQHTHAPAPARVVGKNSKSQT